MTIRRWLALGILGLLVNTVALRPSTAQERFSCTEVLGFSQSWEWYTGESLSESDEVVVPYDAFIENWQGRFEFGAAIEKWRDPSFEGWEGSYVSPQTCPRDAVDRVIFNVSGAGRSIDEWADDILAVVAVVQEKYPAVRRVVLTPVVGAQPGQCANVRAAQNHPTIVQAIVRAVDDDEAHVSAGPTPKVGECEHFSDELGHLSADGARHVHATLHAWYAARGRR